MKEVSLSIQDIKYLIKYLGVKVSCYAKIQRDSAQELDYQYCLSLIERLKDYIHD